jgi:ribonuclease R
MKVKGKRAMARLTKKDLYSSISRLFTENADKAFTSREIFENIGAATHAQRVVCCDLLDDLVDADELTVRDDKYSLSHKNQEVEGKFVRKANGHNSVIPDDGGKSILVTERNSLGAMNGDRVRATILARREKHAREAQVTEILERGRETFVGRLRVDKNCAFLKTAGRMFSNDIIIPRNCLKGGKDGDKAVVKITQWPEVGQNPVGKVTDILGQEGDNNAEMNAILAEFNLPYTYPQNVVEAAERLSPDITPAEIARREDFRNVNTFTIDPKDAKDFDDALSLRRTADGLWEVGIHIADVSHYVKEGDIIDREAVKRATSIYLVDRTIPMLPERLCNFLCSLRQDEEKLAYSTIFIMNDNADIISWHLAHTVIKSNRRFVYDEVQYILEQNGEASPEDLTLPGDHPQPVTGAKPTGEFAEELITLNRLAKKLRKKRFEHGSIAFDRPEVRFEIDENGHPISTYVKVEKDANRLVEEFMLLANRSVAEKTAIVPKGKKPKVFPYRVHDVPEQTKLENLKSFISRFGYKLKTEGSKESVGKSINRLLSDAKGKKEQQLIETVALRTMQKAHYTIDNIGHYGLMFKYYTHFTSPIRRYPDTIVHRLLTRYAEGGRSASATKIEDLCQHASAMEQLADAAERASIKYKQVEFMADRLGMEFDGTVSGVTEFGLYVEVDESKCEGMVPLRDLADDYYEFDEKNYRLVGRRCHRSYSIGDKVKIKVARANLDRRFLDFALVGATKAPGNKPESKKTKNSGRNKKAGKR